jgi:hypothetical protein
MENNLKLPGKTILYISISPYNLYATDFSEEFQIEHICFSIGIFFEFVKYCHNVTKTDFNDYPMA